MQGRIEQEHLEAELSSACGHCGRAIDLLVTSDLRVEVRTPSAAPLVFEPEIDWRTFREPNILDAY